MTTYPKEPRLRYLSAGKKSLPVITSWAIGKQYEMNTQVPPPQSSAFRAVCDPIEIAVIAIVPVHKR